MDQHIEKFKLQLLSRNRALSTIKAYERDLAECIRWLNKHNIISWTELTPQHVRNYLQERVQASPLTATIRRQRAILGWRRFIIMRVLRRLHVMFR